jgi:hypothetical protein
MFESLLGVVLIAGLFVAYAMQRRAARGPSAPETTPAVEPPGAKDEELEPTRGSSPNWALPIVFCALLAAASAHRSSWWGTLWQTLYLGLVALGVYSTFSAREIAAELERRPGLTAAEHRWQSGLPYVAVPVIAWALAIPIGWRPAVLLPALPWLILLIIGVIAAASSRRG